MTTDRKAHCEQVYTDKEPITLACLQSLPEIALREILGAWH